MEVIYNLAIIIFMIVPILFVIGLIKPKSFEKVLRHHATRKKISLYSLIAFISVFIIIGVSEPESVRVARLAAEQSEAARLEDEKLAQLENQQNELQAERLRLEEERKQLETQQKEEQAEKSIPHDPEKYWHKLLAVVDGDVVKARIDGKEQTIRVLGIDTPNPGRTAECYSKQSLAKAKEFLNGKWIKIQSDDTQDGKDKSGRLLRYIYFDEGTDFGKRMIEEGYAYEYTYTKQYQHKDDYLTMQQYAKDKSHGLWSTKTCNGKRTVPKPVSTPAPAPRATTTAPRSAPAQTPAPAPRTYTPAPQKYYANCTAAREAGAAPVYRGQPGYGTHLDRDGDGVGCE